jgi:hypothetical protein
MIKVYLANRPPLPEYLKTAVMNQLPVGEIKRIATETGNHWRKIFNVYAKLIYCLAEKTNHPLLLQHTCWQQYRDQSLLQQGRETELHLDALSIEQAEWPSRLGRDLDCEDKGQNEKKGDIQTRSIVKPLHIVMGKSFSERILKGTTLEWLDSDFAINRQRRIIVCPYFDYRQLSNVKIERLAELIVSLQGDH